MFEAILKAQTVVYCNLCFFKCNPYFFLSILLNKETKVWLNLISFLHCVNPNWIQHLFKDRSEKMPLNRSKFPTQSSNERIEFIYSCRNSTLLNQCHFFVENGESFSIEWNFQGYSWWCLAYFDCEIFVVSCSEVVLDVFPYVLQIHEEKI